jgi:hypothetical protein
MTSYRPAEHEATSSVAPLLEFFELVHVGDTIQSMVQVYLDKELVCPHFVLTSPSRTQLYRLHILTARTSSTV